MFSTVSDTGICPLVSLHFILLVSFSLTLSLIGLCLYVSVSHSVSLCLPLCLCLSVCEGHSASLYVPLRLAVCLCVVCVCVQRWSFAAGSCVRDRSELPWVLVASPRLAPGCTEVICTGALHSDPTGQGDRETHKSVHDADRTC